LLALVKINPSEHLQTLNISAKLSKTLKIIFLL